MQEDKFDDNIRSLLNAVHEEYDKSSWDALSKRMDLNEDLTDGEFVADDQDAYIPIIKEKLEKQRAEVPEEHWEALKSDLEYIEARRKRLYIVKTLEAAIALLLLMTYFNYTWYKSDVIMESGTKEVVQVQKSLPEIIDATLVTNVELPLEISETLVSTHEKMMQPDFLQSRNFAINQDKQLETHFQNIAPAEILISSLKQSLINDISIDKLSITPMNEVQRIPELPNPVVLETSMVPDKNSRDGWSVGVNTSYDFNFINTEINLGYFTNEIELGPQGQSFGLSLGYRKGLFEIESGLKYSEKTFVPGRLTNYTRTSADSFLENQLDHMLIRQIQIPLLGRVFARPSKINKATLFGVAGFAINAIMDNKYAISRTVQTKARLANTPFTDVVNLKDLPQGLVYGGSVSQNVYLTGIIGFGVQSYIKPGLSWYIQPQYQHDFGTEINELVSKVNSLSIEGGVKFAF